MKYERLNKGITRQMPVDVQNNYVFLQEKLEASPHPVMVSLSRSMFSSFTPVTIPLVSPWKGVFISKNKVTKVT